MKKPNRSFWQIWNMSFGFLGIQFGWGLQMANMSSIYTRLGADADKIPILWLAGPVTGLLVQPIIGAMSDRTWGKLGRRRPYFLVGAILSSVALFFMPDSPALWCAAGLLWVLDSCINVSMEPFRAFVGDKLKLEQRTTGFLMQSFFIGVGASLANALPYLFNVLGLTGRASNGIPLAVQYSFKLGAAAFLLSVLWTIFSTKEDPPTNIEEFRAENRKTVGIAAGAREIISALREMPATMKQLAFMQFVTWLGLFCMWMFFGLFVARHVFGTTDTKSPLFDKGTEWGGMCFAFYSAICFVAAPLLPLLAARTSRKFVHSIALACGGFGLLSVYLIHSPIILFLPMAGVGIAWASILAMPYAILSGSIPARRMGVYMGIFNFFIVLPEIVASLTFQPLIKHVFNNDPLYVVMLGGLCMLLASILATRVVDGAPETSKLAVSETSMVSSTAV